MKLEIVIAAQGLAFGPDTLETRSLGGSESAALLMAKELKNLGHMVNVFSNLPPAGREDHIVSGTICDTGVRWFSIEEYQQFIEATEVDLLVVSRNPQLFEVNHRAKKAVLWCHDLATYEQKPHIMNIAFNFNEVWCISEFHKKQFNSVTDYPLKNIKVTRNGIAKFEESFTAERIYRDNSILLYSARPERGLENLVKEGGIMEKLPDFTLKVTMYDNYPQHLMGYYQYLWSRCDHLPNVELLGSLTQKELRKLMNRCGAYVYPTKFEEVSCIIARECMEAALPVICTSSGALLETLKGCGHIYHADDEHIGTEQFMFNFANHIKSFFEDEQLVNNRRIQCMQRKDLYWDEVAKQWVEMAKTREMSNYTILNSLIEYSDIIPAMALAETIQETSPGITWLKNELKTKYRFARGEVSMSEHYRGVYELEEKKGAPERKQLLTLKGENRYNQIALHVSKLKEKATILDFGCAEGAVTLQLAKDFPDKHFFGIDIVSENVDLCIKYAEQHNIQNASFHLVLDSALDDYLHNSKFDAAIVAEVLEHTISPWETINRIEKGVKKGGRVIITVPQGPWEMLGLKNDIQWNWRAHIWHIDKWMIRQMFSDKENIKIDRINNQYARGGKPLGHIIVAYDADIEKPAHSVDPIEKVDHAIVSQTLAACIIAKNAQASIVQCLDSVEADCNIIQVALGPCTDHTNQIIHDWANDHPWIDFRVIHVPSVEVGKYGFDDARNDSTEGIEADWIIWIDSDEYLSGPNLKYYLRDNHCDGYAICQHHFTVDPRGEPALIDRPTRLIRNDGRYACFGKVHEHFELGYNQGPGFVMLLPSIDIGHTGYVNNHVRRQRFARNFPLLEWDRKEFPDRNLGKYLWLRDIIHRIQIAHESGDINQGRLLAEEAVKFYHENFEVFDKVGGGLLGGNQALQYYTDAMRYLGRGVPVQFTIEIEENKGQYGGFFNTPEDALEIARLALSKEFAIRKSKYWR